MEFLVLNQRGLKKNYFVSDVNECDGESLCQHHCYNLIGSFLCQCDHGFELAADKVSCEGGQAQKPTHSEST